MVGTNKGVFVSKPLILLYIIFVKKLEIRLKVLEQILLRTFSWASNYSVCMNTMSLSSMSSACYPQMGFLAMLIKEHCCTHVLARVCSCCIPAMTNQLVLNAILICILQVLQTVQHQYHLGVEEHQETFLDHQKLPAVDI